MSWAFGLYGLNVEMQRCMSSSVPRGQRLCRLSGEDKPIEVEMHIRSCPLDASMSHTYGAHGWAHTSLRMRMLA